MGPFEALKSLFFGNAAGRARVGDAFVQLDVNALAEKLRLQERGAEDGALSLPDAGASTFGVVETEIVNTIGDFHQAAQIDLRNQMQAYETRFGDLQLLHQTGSIRSFAVEASGDFQTLVRECKNKTDLDRQDIRDAFVDLQAFKRANGIVGPAKDIPPKFVTFGIIIVSFIVEVLLNAAYLQTNDDFGFIGGVTDALGVSAINIAIAYIFGRHMIPKRNLADKASKLTGNISVAVWLILATCWNLLAAHYRDAKYSGDAAPQSAALRGIIDQPLMLDGIFSLGIFIIGMAIALLVMFDAYNMDDSVPGYGERSRAFHDRGEAYSEKIAQFHKELSSVRNDAIEGANQVKNQLGLQLAERENIERSTKRYIERYRQYEQHLENVCNQILAIYRNANRRARSTSSDVPSFFNIRYKLHHSEVHLPYVQPVNERDIEDARSSLDRCIENVETSFRSSITEFPSVAEIISEANSGSV